MLGLGVGLGSTKEKLGVNGTAIGAGLNWACLLPGYRKGRSHRLRAEVENRGFFNKLKNEEQSQ